MLSRLLLIIAGLFIGVLLVEVVLRGVAPDWLEYRMTVLNVAPGTKMGTDRGWPVERIDGGFHRFSPNTSFLVSHSEYQNTAHINEYGARYTGKYEKTRTTIPFLGDSFTFGVGVEDRETFPSLLGTMLGVNALNLGVPGSTLRDQINLMLVRHDDLDGPNLYLIFFFAGNDFNDLYERQKTRISNNGNIKKNSDRFGTYLEDLNYFANHTYLLRKSYVAQFLKSEFLRFYSTNMETDLLVMQRNEEYRNTIKDLLNQELQKLKKSMQKLKTNAAIFIVPSKYQLDDEVRNRQSQYYGINVEELDPYAPNRILVSMAGRLEIPVFDATRCMKNRFTKNMYYVRDNHFTKIGHKIYAECVGSDLLGMLSRSGV